jgi:ribonucleoside-diphosphate reductase alpha chain
VSNIREISEDAASKSLEVLKQISSTGYLRKRLPQELVVLNGGGAPATARMPADASAPMQAILPDSASASLTVSSSATMTATAPMDAAAKARMQGYEGEACGDCGNYTLVRNGTCMKCNTCGATSGCS